MSEKKREQRTRINWHIKADPVRLIGIDGEQRVVSIKEALLEAEGAGLDLVEISPNAKPPVVKVMDFGKFKFEQKKKLAQAKKKQTQVKVKEIKFRPNTDVGDYEVKLRNLISFLEHGDKAKVSIRFRGREIAHNDLGMELAKRLLVDLEAHGTVEQQPRMEGRQIVMVFAPKSK